MCEDGLGDIELRARCKAKWAWELTDVDEGALHISGQLIREADDGLGRPGLMGREFGCYECDQ